MRTLSLIAALGLATISASACTLGSIGGGEDGPGKGGPGGPGSGPDTVNPGPAPLRRLTNDEYNSTVHDLLGDTTAPGNKFPGPSTSTAGYDTYATGLGVSSTHAQDYLEAAEALAKTAVAPAALPDLVKCDVAAKGEAACLLGFLTDFGQRAFRRPLTQGETGRFQQLFANARMTDSFEDSIRVVLEAFLVSPAFLYRIELGAPGKAGDLVKLTSWEMATRLSYLFLGSMPDDELFKAAGADALQTPAQIEQQARRLVADPRARDAFKRFVDQWLELRTILSMQKDATKFPDYSADLNPLLKEEANRVVDSVVWDGDGDARKMFSADYTFLNGPLAAFYGVNGPTGDAFVKVSLDPGERKGVLTLAGPLAAHAKPADTLPPRRGKFFRLKVFCVGTGDPPPNAAAKAPQRTPDMTTRDYFTAVEQQAACGSCHKLIDGVGFGLEAFDATGQFRTMDQGKPVDASGQLFDTDVDGPFNGAVELASRVASSEQAMSCMALQLFRYANGRPETDADEHSLAVLSDAFKQHAYDVKELLVTLTQTDAFLLKTSQGVSQ